MMQYILHQCNDANGDLLGKANNKTDKNEQSSRKGFPFLQ